MATLILPQQDVTTRGQSAYGESLAFNTWHARKEHEPVESIAAARKAVSRASANVRRNSSATPLGEPTATAARRSGSPEFRTRRGRMPGWSCAAIHPAIGVARVGNSPAGFFVGPEVTDPAPEKPGFYRDENGALKRQAARFRVYGYNAAGEVVGELTADTADDPVDRPRRQSQGGMVPVDDGDRHPRGRRSARSRDGIQSVTGDDRKELVIDGGPKSIAGKGTRGAEYEFHGKFQGVDVYLGEVRTDDAGRFLFLGGHGVSASPTGSTIYNQNDPNGFINADDWYDDMSDGPVAAMFRLRDSRSPLRQRGW